MAIKVIELVNGTTIICDIISTVIPVDESGKDLEPVHYITTPVQIRASLDDTGTYHQIHVMEWMIYTVEQPLYIKSSQILFSPMEPSDLAKSAYAQFLTQVLSTSKSTENSAEHCFNHENLERIVGEEKDQELLESIDKNPKKVIN